MKIKIFKTVLFLMIAVLFLGTVSLVVYGKQPNQKKRWHLKLGRLCKKAGLINEAISHYQKALTISPDFIAPRFELALAYKDKRDYTSAMTEVDNILSQSPSELNAILLRTLIFFEQKKYEEVLSWIQIDGKNLDQNGDFQKIWADTLSQLGKIDEALPHYREAIDLKSQDIDFQKVLRKSLIEILILKKSWGEAIIECENYLNRISQDIEPYYLLYKIYFNQGQLDKAHKYLDMILNKKPDHNDALKARAQIKVLQNDFESALEDISTVLKFSPNDYFAHYLKGKALFFLGRYDGALISLQLVAQVVPERADVHFMLGNIYQKLGNFQQAVSEYNKVVEIIPDSLQARSTLAQLNMKQGWYEGVIEQCLAILSTKPNDIDAMRLLAYAYLNERHYEDAFPHFEKLNEFGYLEDRLTFSKLLTLRGECGKAYAIARQMLETSSYKAVAYSVMGLSMMCQGDTPAAIYYLKKSLKADPLMTEARMNLGNLYLKKGQYKSAETIFKEGRHVSHRMNHEFRYKLALTYIADKNFVQALVLLKAIIKEYPKNPSVLFQVARAYIGFKRYHEAIAILKKLVKKHPKLIDAHALLASAFEKAGREKDAIHQWENVSLMDPKYFGLERLGYLYARRGLWVKAITLYKSLNLSNSNANPYIYRLILCEMEGGYFRGAESRLIELNSSEKVELLDSLLYIHLGILSKEVSRAWEFIQGVQDERGTHSILKNLVSFANKQPQEAIDFVKLLNKVIFLEENHRLNFALLEITKTEKNFPEIEIVSYLRIQLLSMLRRYDEAIEIAKGMLKRNPGDFLKDDLGVLYLKKRKMDEAKNLYIDLVKKNPKFPGAQQKLAQIYTKINQMREAKNCYEKLLEIDPDNSEILNNLSWIEFKEKDYDKAIQHAYRAVELSPQNSQAIDTLGWILLGKGELQKGFELLSKAKHGLPGNPTVRYHFAKALVMMGRLEEAKDELKIAFQIQREFQDSDEALLLMKEIERPSGTGSAALETRP